MTGQLRAYVEPLAVHSALVIPANSVVSPSDMSPDAARDCVGFSELRIAARADIDFGRFAILVSMDHEGVAPTVLDDAPLTLPAMSYPGPGVPNFGGWVLLQTVDIVGMKVVALFVKTYDLEVRDFKLRAFLLR